MGDGPGGGRLNCIFPFKYAGLVIDKCTDIMMTFTKHRPWCSTKVDKKGAHIQGYWGNCDKSCPLFSPIPGNGKDKQGSLEVFNKGRSRGRENKRRKYLQAKPTRVPAKWWPPRPRDPCDKKIEAILKKVMKKLEMSQLIENKALKMVTEMMDEHGYGYMDDEDDMDFQVFSPPKDVRLRRKGFASKYSEEEEQDMDDVANEAMDSEDDDQNDATTADPSDLNAEAPDDDYEADPVEVGTETNSMDEPIDEPIDEDDISETGGSAEMEDYDAITPAYEPEE